MNFSKCFIYSVDDIHMAAGFLCQLFPCVTGLGYGLQADMYNMFDVAICFSPGAAAAEVSSTATPRHIMLRNSIAGATP